MCLKIKILPALKDSLSFAFDLKRISLMFSMLFLTGFAVMFSMIALFSYFATNLISSGAVAAGLLLFAIMTLSILLSILIKGSFIHNYTIRSANENIIKSIDALNGKVAELIGATILIFLISVVLDIIPFIGQILNIIFSFAIIFAFQEIMLGKKGAVDSLKGSLNLFKKYWKDVIVSAIILFVLSAIIVGIFAMPLIATFVSTIVALKSAEISLFIPAFLASVSQNAGAYIISIMILVVGLAITSLLNTGFLTDVYLQLGARKNSEKPQAEAVMAKAPSRARQKKSRKARARKRKR